MNSKQNDGEGQYQSTRERKKLQSNEKSSCCCTNAILCWMRIMFIPIMIILIVVVLLSGIFHGTDILVQGVCRLVHNDQPFLVTFLTGFNRLIYIIKLFIFNLI